MSFGGEPLVHLAGAGVDDHLDAGLPRDVGGEEPVGDHDHLRHAEALDHLHGVAGGAADVGFGLHRCGGVHVGDHRHAGVGCAQGADVLRRDRLGQRAARAQVGDQHGLGRVQQLRGLRHEVHAGQHDDVGLDVDGLTGQGEGVADDVGDAVEDLRGHVVVGEDHGVALLLQPHDRVHVVGHGGPLDGRHDVRHLRVEVGCSQRCHRIPLPGTALCYI